MLIPAFHIQASLKGVSWTDTRSEGHTPSILFSEESSPFQWDSRGTSYEQAMSSTSSGTLQPPYPRYTGAVPPITTSTARMVTAPEREDAGPSGESKDFNGPRSSNTVRQAEVSSRLSLPARSGDHVPVRTGKTGAHLAKLLEEVRRLQKDVRSKRSQTRDLRHALRQKREEEDYLRLVLEEKLSWLSPESIHLQTPAISKAIEDLKAATGLYHTLESDYQRIEDEHNKEETLLDKRTTRLNKLLRRQVAPWNEQKDSVNSFSDTYSTSSSAYDADSDPDRFSSEAAEYLTLVGEVRMLREQLRELKSEYMALLDQEDLRERIGLSLDPAALEFLAGYEDAKAKTQAGLDFAIRRVMNHPEHKDHPEAATFDDQWDQVVKDFQPETPDIQAPRDPLRVTEFEDQSPFFEERRPVAMNKFTFVNRWLLHRLRHSSFEVLQYKSHPGFTELANEGWDGDSISQMALMLWFRDETAGLVTVRDEFAE